MKQIIRCSILAIFPFVHNFASAQCSAAATVVDLGSGSYSITNGSTSNGNGTDASIQLLSSSPQNQQVLYYGDFVGNETKSVQSYLNQLADSYAVVIRDSSYTTCDSTVFSMAGNVLWDFHNCANDVTVTETSNGTISIANNSVSNGVPVGVYMYFNNINGNANSIYVGAGQTSIFQLPNNGTFTYDIYMDQYVSCYQESGVITISTGNPTSCTAQFSTSLSGNTYTFYPSANASGASYTYTWNFGDGTSTSSATHSAVSHVLQTTGLYAVCLTVSNAQDSCSATYCDTIGTATPACNATFSSIPNGGNAFHFNAHFPNQNASFEWDFGDGTSAIGSLQNYTYASNGSYQVCLTVTDSTTNCTDSYCSYVYATSLNTPCDATFTVFDSTANQIFLYAYNTSPSATFTWDLGNGIAMTGNNLDYDYATQGTYTVCLTVTDTLDGGCVSTQCQTIVVGDSVNIIGCNAHFVVTQDSLDPTLFYAWNMSTGNNLSYLWSFGDGTTSTDPYPIHVYDEVGIYNLCLHVSNPDNCMDSLCVDFEVIVKSQGVTLQVMNGAPSNTNELEQFMEWAVYPNPVETQLTVTWEDQTDADFTVQLMDINGKVVLSEKVASNSGKGEYRLDVSTLEAGMYLLQLQDQTTGKYEFQRVIKK